MSDIKTITLYCDKCKKSYEIRYKNFLKRKRLGRPNLCNECMKIYSIEKQKETCANRTEEEKQKVYESKHNSWINKSDEEKKKFSEAVSKGLSNMSDETKKNRGEKIGKAQKKRHENMPIEEKERLEKLRNEGFRKWRDNLTEEELIEESIRKRNEQLNLSEEKKLIRNQKLREASKNRFMKLSYKDFIVKEYNKAINCNNKSNEEKIKYLNKNGTEYEFIKLLEFYNIPYKLHYYNTGIYNSTEYYYLNLDNLENFNEYPQFRLLFSQNLVTGNKYISPFHEWDFAIIKDNKFYTFIDLDGTAHDINHMKIKAKREFEYIVQDYHQFKDSQRLYQTDGYSAYIVQCYNDKLLDDTPVLNLQMNTKRTLKNFLENLSKLINK